jgi:hypothetical protein
MTAVQVSHGKNVNPIKKIMKQKGWALVQVVGGEKCGTSVTPDTQEVHEALCSLSYNTKNKQQPEQNKNKMKKTLYSLI